MDLLCIFGGAFIGSIIAAVIAFSIPNIPFPARAGIELIGVALGVIGGYLILWQNKRLELQANADAYRKQQAETKTPPQIVGSKCAQCNKSIMFIVDAHICRRCNMVNCKECSPKLPCPSCAKPPVAEPIQNS